jgi:hypothetical protein
MLRNLNIIKSSTDVISTQCKISLMWFEVLGAVVMKSSLFWVITPCKGKFVPVLK